MNLTAEGLRSFLSGQDGPLRAYVMSSVQDVGGVLIHAGSGPNFQGGLLTICTCKHLMRTVPQVHEETWVSGLAGLHVVNGAGNSLFYLAKIHRISRSQWELWKYLKTNHPPEVRLLKAARTHRFGDVFEPRVPYLTADDPRVNMVESYYPPCDNHSHHRLSEHTRRPVWHEDVDYASKSGSRQKFLIADPCFTFIWSKPILQRLGGLGRLPYGYPTNLQSFLKELSPM